MYASKKAKSNESTAFLEGYLTCAKEMEIPLRLIAERLGEILSASGQRTPYKVSKLRTDSNRNSSSGETVAKVEANGSTHRRAPHPNKGKKLAWWKRLSAEEKAAIIAKRVAGAKARRAA